MSIIQVDTLQKRDGSTFPLGKIGQVISSDYTTAFDGGGQQLNTTSFTDLNNMSVTITPTSTSSKIMILATITAGVDDNTGGRAFTRLLRDTTSIAMSQGVTDSGVTQEGGLWSFSVVDSPSTTSAVTYKIQARSTNSSLDIRYNQNAGEVSSSHIIAMEVLAWVQY